MLKKHLCTGPGSNWYALGAMGVITGIIALHELRHHGTLLQYFKTNRKSLKLMTDKIFEEKESLLPPKHQSV